MGSYRRSGLQKLLEPLEQSEFRWLETDQIVTRYTAGLQMRSGQRQWWIGEVAEFEAEVFLALIRYFHIKQSNQRSIQGGQRKPFSYTGSPKTEQGGDNQARHVVLKPLSLLFW